MTDTQKGFGCIKEKKDAEILYWYFSWSGFTKEAGEYMQKGMESELFLEENWYRGNIYVNWVIEYTNCINNAIINL